MNILLRVFNGSEYGGDIDNAIVKLTPDLAKTILERKVSFLKLQEKHEDLLGAIYECGEECQYLHNIGLDEDHQDVLKVLDDDKCKTELDFPEDSPFFVEIEYPRMHIEKNGVYWSCFRKHGDANLETAMVTYNEVEEALG